MIHRFRADGQRAGRSTKVRLVIGNRLRTIDKEAHAADSEMAGADE
jgi:hypothetical protein